MTRHEDHIGNRILLALPVHEFNRLYQHLRLVELQRGQMICHPGQPVQDFYFINRGLVSLIKRMRNGEAVEIGAQGIEGVTSPEVLLGVATPFHEAMIQVPGAAFHITKSVLQQQFEQGGRLKSLLLSYIHAAADQVAQAAACNRLHVLEQRICRWILTAQDNARSDTFPITQEFLAMLLGVHRPGMSLALAKLQEAGLLKYVRGHLTVIERAKVEALACECYQAIRNEFDRLFPKRDVNSI